MQDVDEIIIGLRNQPFYELTPDFFCTFKIGGKKWRTLIHYWTAMYFTDEFMIDWIRNQETVQMALNCAKKAGFKDFYQVPTDKIILGLQERFNQNDGLRSILLSTGVATIKYMGSRGFFSDKNRYGRMLMRIREVYQE